MAMHTTYMTDVYRNEEGGRVGMGDYIAPVVAPARRKAAQALREYNAGQGSPAELGMIIGKGLHNLLSVSSLAEPKAREISSDSVLDGAVIASLAEMAQSNETLMKEVRKYASQDDLDKAKGLKTVYDITRASQEAMERMKEAVKEGVSLPDTERKACIELMLMERAMLVATVRHATANQNEEEENQISSEFNKQYDEAKTNGEKAVLNVLITSKMSKRSGLPDFVKVLGQKGPDGVREMLDLAIPGRKAFLQQSDADILKALSTAVDAPDDPFQNKEYQKQTYQQERELDKALKAWQQRNAPQAGGGVKTL